MPWIDGYPQSLPDNREIARFQQMKIYEQYKTKPNFDTAYQSFIPDYIKRGYLEPMPKDTAKVFVLVAFFVEKDSISTPFRGVLNCRARYGGVSIYDGRFKGRNPIQLLPNILCRARNSKFAAQGDVCKMFHCVNLFDDDRNMNGLYDIDGNLLRFTVVAFGLISSPNMAVTALEHLLEQFGSEELKKQINMIYMDDITIVHDNKDELKRLFNEAVQIWSSHGFKIAKMASNSPGRQNLPKPSQTPTPNAPWRSASSRSSRTKLRNASKL